MSFEDDVKKFMQAKQAEKAAFPAAQPATATVDRDALARRMRMTYDNASEREIEKAIDEAFEKLDDLTDTRALDAFLRVRLED